MKYNIMHEKWIRTLYTNGEYKTISVVEAIQDAHKIRDLSETSPIAYCALIRFLCAIVFDVYHFETDASVQATFNEGKFDVDRVLDYIKNCNMVATQYYQTETDVFNLFDVNKPFLQLNNRELQLNMPKYNDNKNNKVSVAKLFHDQPSGNNNTFRHCKLRTAYSLAEVTKAMVVYPMFTPLMDGPTGHASIHKKYTFALVYGKTLFELIVFNMVSLCNIYELYNDDHFPIDTPPLPWNILGDQTIDGKTIIQSMSFLQGMYHQTRGYQLILDDDGLIRNIYGMVYYPKYKCDVWFDINKYYFQNSKTNEWYDYDFPEEFNEITDKVFVFYETEGKRKTIIRPTVMNKFLDEETTLTSFKGFDSKFYQWNIECLNLIVIGAHCPQGSIIDTFKTNIAIPKKLLLSNEKHDFAMSCIEGYLDIVNKMKKVLAGTTHKNRLGAMNTVAHFKNIITQMCFEQSDLFQKICSEECDYIKIKKWFNDNIYQSALSSIRYGLEVTQYSYKEKVAIEDNMRNYIIKRLSIDSLAERNGDLNLEKQYKRFFAKLLSLSDSDKTTLRKSIGLAHDTNMSAYIVFLKLLDNDVQFADLDMWFLAACVSAYQQQNEINSNIPNAVKALLKKDSKHFIEKKFTDLLLLNDVSKKDARQQIVNIVKELNKNGYYISPKHLLHSLLNWQQDDEVRKEWARECFSKIKIKKEK